MAGMELQGLKENKHFFLSEEPLIPQARPGSPERDSFMRARRRIEARNAKPAPNVKAVI